MDRHDFDEGADDVRTMPAKEGRLAEWRHKLERKVAAAASVGWFIFRLVTVATISLSVGIFITAAVGASSFAAAVSSAATVRYWLLRGTPQGHIMPLHFDFARFHETRSATAMLVAEGAARHCTHGETPADAIDEFALLQGWQPCDGQFSPMVFSGGWSAFTLSVLLELPDDVAATGGMANVELAVIGRRPVPAVALRAELDPASMTTTPPPAAELVRSVDVESFVIARGAVSGAVRKVSPWLHWLRSVALLPARFFGYEVNTQLLDLPVVRNFAPPLEIADAITHINITVSTSKRTEELQIYAARLVLDVDLRGYASFYLQRYPVVTFAFLTMIFFTMYFGVSASAVSLLVGGTIVWLDIGPLARRFIWGSDENSTTHHDSGRHGGGSRHHHHHQQQHVQQEQSDRYARRRSDDYLPEGGLEERRPPRTAPVAAAASPPPSNAGARPRVVESDFEGEDDFARPRPMMLPSAPPAARHDALRPAAAAHRGGVGSSGGSTASTTAAKLNEAKEDAIRPVPAAATAPAVTRAKQLGSSGVSARGEQPTEVRAAPTAPGDVETSAEAPMATSARSDPDEEPAPPAVVAREIDSGGESADEAPPAPAAVVPVRAPSTSRGKRRGRHP